MIEVCISQKNLERGERKKYQKLKDQAYLSNI